MTKATIDKKIKELKKSKHPLRGLGFHTGVLRTKDEGFILAYVPAWDKRDEERSVTITLWWQKGKIIGAGTANFAIYSCGIINKPANGIVKIGFGGSYSVETKDGVTAGKIFKNSNPQKPTYSEFSSVGVVDGNALAVGLRGVVRKLQKVDEWVPMDKGLPTSFDSTAIAGSSMDDIYLVGYDGRCFHFDGTKWTAIKLPTRSNLHCVICAPDGTIYIAGKNGTFLHGQKNKWGALKFTTDNFWGLTYFNNKIYATTSKALYEINPKTLKAEVVDFKKDKPGSFSHLSAVDGMLWSIGEHDIMSFDGKKWKRVA